MAVGLFTDLTKIGLNIKLTPDPDESCLSYNIGRFRSLSAKDFSFESTIGSLGISDKYDINKMYVTYISKVFGYIPKKKELPEMLLESLSNAVKEGRVPSHSSTALKIIL